MAKRIALCLDGTWNSEDKHDGGAKTNVARLCDALDPGPDQSAHYFPGVGTAVGEKVTGGAFGWRLFDQIKNAYRALAADFEPGDQIYLFGFSRGAYSARSLAGMITRCGVLRKDAANTELHVPASLLDLVTTDQDPKLALDATDRVFAMYKYAYAPEHRDEVEAFKQKYCHDTNVHLVGVWDTVGALGLPNGLLFSEFRSVDLKLKDELFGFLDTKLSPRVEAAYHAVAIDEHREPFLPTLWTEASEAKPRINLPDSQVEQVWFVGAHSNVGGGYVDTGLSDITLQWMIERARRNGLRFTAGTRERLRPDAAAKRRDSLTEFLDYFGDTKNPVLAWGERIFDKAKQKLIGVDRPIPTGSCLHASVNQRLAAKMVCEPLANAPYNPPPTLKLASGADVRRADANAYRVVSDPQS